MASDEHIGRVQVLLGVVEDVDTGGRDLEELASAVRDEPGQFDRFEDSADGDRDVVQRAEHPLAVEVRHSVVSGQL